MQSYGPVMWSICYSHAINMHQSCDQYAPVMWSMCTSHVINMHQSCDQCAPVMWSICYSHVINMHQSCDQYAPVMWSIWTSRVSNVYKSRDQYATVMRSMCTSHVINMCYLATAWKYLVKAWALVKTICGQSQNLCLVNITFDRPFPKILWFLLFGGHLNQIVITILIVSLHFWYQLQHFFRIMSH